MIKLVKSTKEAVLATLPPQSTRTYKAISHGQIINTVLENLDKQGFKVTNESYYPSAGNSIVRGHLCLNLNLDKDLKFEIAFMNSYNKQRRAVVVGGSQVWICENGHILGSSQYGAFKRKHTGTASEDINIFIPEMIKNASDNFNILIKQKDRMKEIEITKKVRNELIGQFYLEDAILKDVQMSILRKEFEKPTFDYGSPGSLWETYNYVTFALKETHPAEWLEKHQNLNKIVNDKFQLV